MSTETEQSLSGSINACTHCNSLLQTVLSGTHDGIAVLDPNGNIQYRNQKFNDIWRIPEEYFESKHNEELLSAALEKVKEPEGLLKLASRIQQGNIGSESREIAFRDGRTILLSITPQQLHGEVVGIVASFCDITQARKDEQELSEYVSELEQFNKIMIERELKMSELKERIRQFETGESMTGPVH